MTQSTHRRTHRRSKSPTLPELEQVLNRAVVLRYRLSQAGGPGHEGSLLLLVAPSGTISPGHLTSGPNRHA